jgi:glycosyltransferase involved in cell wall biosynthesis
MHLGIIASMKNGLEHFVYREMCQLAARGASISVFPTKHRPGLYNPRSEWSVQRWRVWAVLCSQPWRFVRQPLRYLSAFVDALRYRALADFLLAAYFAPAMRDVDVIYATFGDQKLYVGYFCKRLVKRPLAVTIHAYELYRNPNPKLFSIALADCDQIVTVTDYNRDILHRRFGIALERVNVVRLSIDLQEYCPARKFVILMVAHFVEKKGHEVLLEAVKRIGRQDVEVWVVGGRIGSRSDVDVPAIVQSLGLESQVAFFGKLCGTALKAVYNACDVFCLPSRVDRFGDAEGFPTAIIEAMACGKPVVTTRHVEIPRIVEQVLVGENDAGALAEALEQVYQSRANREMLGARNRQLAEMHFSTANIDERVRQFREISRCDDGRRSPCVNADNGHLPDVSKSQRAVRPRLRQVS